VAEPGYISKVYAQMPCCPHIQSMLSPSVMYRSEDCSGVYPLVAAICCPIVRKTASWSASRPGAVFAVV
jgi:hypothetical protein